MIKIKELPLITITPSSNSPLLTDVGLRDGLQSLPTILPTNKKMEILELLIKSNLSGIELTSFTNPKMIPQLWDSAEFSKLAFSTYPTHKDLFTCLIPNAKGAIRAAQCGYEKIRYLISASETHNLKNTGRSIQESFDDLQKILSIKGDLEVSVIFATAFICPFEGSIPVSRIVSLVEKAQDMGVSQIGLADTQGTATSDDVNSILDAIKVHYEASSFYLHMHNKSGNGYQNIWAAYQKGFRRFDVSFSGLGGCPVIPEPYGNIDTLSLINFFRERHVTIPIDRMAYVKIQGIIDQII